MGESLLVVVNKALIDVSVQPKDEAAAELARTYARRIDAGEPIDKVGPPLLRCLEALLMTPQVRATVLKGQHDGPKAASPLDELRQRRASRAASVD